MKKVYVLLSTYNGEKYLVDQINSVLEQKDVDVTLWVRDDGSSDSTVSILREFEEKGQLILFTGENLGYRKSFMELCHKVHLDADYFAFCDQDDVWKPEKLATAIREIGDTTEPTLAISDLEMVDSELRTYSPNASTFPVNYDEISREQLKKLVSIETILIGYGCTQVWNLALQKLAIQNHAETKYNHDYVLGILSIMCGHFIAIPQKLIYYRQHGDNTSGARTGFAKQKTDIKRHIETLFGKRIDPISAVDKNMLECYGHLMNEKSVETLQKVVNYKSSWKKRMELLFSDYYTGLKRRDVIKTKIKILLGIL